MDSEILLIEMKQETDAPFSKDGPVSFDVCVFKKCCKKYKRKGRHCKNCPKL